MSFCEMVELNRYGLFSKPISPFVYGIKNGEISHLNSLIEHIKGKDIGIVSVFSGEPGIIGNTDYLYWREELNQFDVKIVIIQRRPKVLDEVKSYRSVDNQHKKLSEERAFMLINDYTGLASESFIAWINALGKLAGQRSVLVKPAETIHFNGQKLEAEAAFELFMSGAINYKGTLKQGLTEGYIIQSMDFSEVYGTPVPNKSRHLYNRACIFNKVYFEENRVLLRERLHAY